MRLKRQRSWSADLLVRRLACIAMLSHRPGPARPVAVLCATLGPVCSSCRGDRRGYHSLGLLLRSCMRGACGCRALLRISLDKPIYTLKVEKIPWEACAAHAINLYLLRLPIVPRCRKLWTVAGTSLRDWASLCDPASSRPRRLARSRRPTDCCPRTARRHRRCFCSVRGLCKGCFSSTKHLDSMDAG